MTQWANYKSEFDALDERVLANVERIVRLQVLYLRLTKKKKGGRSSVQAVDILRSAVVFLHATLEDFTRSLGLICLPLATKELLDAVPLAGERWTRSPKKFHLGHLVQHRGRTVDELLQESLKGWLDRTTFNDLDELLAFFSRFDLHYGGSQSDKKLVSSLIKRRHKIVHEVDQQTSVGSGNHRTRSLSYKQVDKWIHATLDFASDMRDAAEEALAKNDVRPRTATNRATSSPCPPRL